MNPRDYFLKWFCAWGRVTPAFVLLLLARQAQANPTGLTVVSGSAAALSSGSQLNITTSQTAVLNWSSFNIAAGEKTVFNQPSINSIVINNIGGQSASQIYGSLQANGIVVLLNSSGFYFGPNSFVSAAGLVVSTANFTPPQNTGGAWEFNGPPPLASIVNYGQIKIGNGGDCFFIADHIQNQGTVEADGGGSVQFAAGQTVTLSERPDGRGMSMAVTLPKGSVDNYGNVIADGGTIALNAKVVNQDGLIEADSVQNNNGVIELVASDSLNLGASSQILARGDGSAGGSAGGNVTLQSQNDFSDAAGSQIVTTGGANGGNGGNVEVSAPNMAAINSTINGGAQAGYTGGQLLIDPNTIILDTSGSGSAGSGTVSSGSSPGTLDLNVNSAFLGFANITLQAKSSITLADGTTWNLSGSTGLNAGQLTLESGGNISIGTSSGAMITDANAWNVTLEAGYNFGNNTVTPGTGNIVFNGAGALQLGSGLVNLIAGNNITVNTGYVITTRGGAIYAHALSGAIDTGSDPQGYNFNSSATTLATAYNLNSGLGGISTAAGGNVTLVAGTDVNSLDPVASGYDYLGNFTSDGNIAAATAGAGAYGALAGNVTVIAGASVTGHYTVANGTGNIYAGVQMDANGNPIANGSGGYALGAAGNAGMDLNKNSLSLSLVAGGWNITAADNINLTEVNNPNGDYNTSGTFKNYFNYAPSDYVDLDGINGVSLGGNASTLRRVSGLTVPVIYPGILNLDAGAGGVMFTGDTTFGKLILFPSPLGSLVIDTTGGGSLSGLMPAVNGVPQIFQLILSDSSAVQFKTSTTFGTSDHATTPIHLGSEEPVELNISGNIDLFSLYSSEAATINVVGDLINSRFQGMNLNDADTTTINVGQAAKTAMENDGVLNAATDGSLAVGGDIQDTSAFTTIDISGLTVPDLSLLARATDNSLSAATLENAFYYNPATQTLTYQNINGQTLAGVLSLLQNLTVQAVDANGNLLWQDSLHTIPVTEQVSVLSPAVAAALTVAYQPLPSDLGPLAIGGGGTFLINADNIDLGTTAGIISYGVGLYNVRGAYPLAQLFNTGANIVVNATGDLTMPSSAIASFNGGDIYVNADGAVNVGSTAFNVTSTGARGIFSTGLGNVAVYAGGDIDVQGSRIAVYDTRPLESGSPAPGGSLTVVSRAGDINVGSGGSGFVVLSSYFVDPVTRQVSVETPTIPGTGLLETSYNRDGNVLVEALAGNVTVGAGGIAQLLFKGSETSVNWDQLSTLLRLALEGNPTAAIAYENQANGLVSGVAPPDIYVYAGQGDVAYNPDDTMAVDQFGNPTVDAQNLLDYGFGSSGTPNFTGAPGKDLVSNGPGVIGAGNEYVSASGSATGNFFTTGNLDVTAVNSVDVTAIGLGTVTVASDSGSVSGTIIGGAGVNVSGDSITADIESNGSISGQTSGSSGFAVSQSANNVSAGIGNEANNTAATATTDQTDDELNKKKKPVALAQKISRVTVLLPKRD